MSSLKFMLAKDFVKGKNDPVGWLLSEKYDGYRACYCPKDKQMYSRQNKLFHAPQWFLDAMPDILVDGELWIGRNMFQEMGAVRKKVPLDEEWMNITFQVYDTPLLEKSFQERLTHLSQIVQKCSERWEMNKQSLPYPLNKLPCPVVLAKQEVVQSWEHLDQVYKRILKEGGEGIMIKDPQSPYEGKRSKYMLKYKPSFDEDAIIIDHTPGQGKYKGKLGAFLCRPLINHDTYSSIDPDDDHIFSISGMDDEVRESYEKTHPVATIISYEHSGKTDKGKPRFGRYTRIRTDILLKDHVQEDIDIVKQKITSILKVLGTHEKNNGQGFKASAYFRAVKNIRDLSVLSESSLKSVKGIGSSLSKTIMEIVNTGTCQQYESLQSKKDYKSQFLDISGVGPKKAKELVEKGFQSIEQLRKAPNLSDLLNDKQRIGLKYYEDILERIPQQEIDQHQVVLKTLLNTIDPQAELTIAGSYRRRQKDSGDIDVLLKGSPQLYKQLITLLESKGYLYETLAKGNKKYNGMCKLPNCITFRRIDIMITKPNEYPFAILYFTGSKDFNTLMRQHALDLGYSMNEYSLKHIDTKQPVDHTFTTEKDIFEYLNFEYVDPWLR